MVCVEKKDVIKKFKLDKIILVQEATSRIGLSDWQEITKGSFFLFEKEHKLSNNFCSAFLEMTFLINRFEIAYQDILTNPPPYVLDHISQLNQNFPNLPKNFVVEFHAIDLSTYFKSFLLLSKSVLDKLVPLYSYRFYDNLRQFDDKGARLIKSILRNKHVTQRKQMVDLVEKAKTEWLDSLISLRDQYAHYSNLKEYKNFWIPGEWLGTKKFSDLTDFHKPTLEVANKEIEALDYIVMIKNNLISFLRDFLCLCDFTQDRRPKTYLRCECGYVFAKKIGNYPKEGKIQILGDLNVEVKDRDKRYGLIICPDCGDKTDTDLDYWPPETFSTS